MRNSGLWKKTGRIFITGGLILSMGLAGVQPAAAASSAVTAAREPEEEQLAFDEYMDELFAEMMGDDYYNIHFMLDNPSKYGIDLKRHAFGKEFLKDAGLNDDEWKGQAAAVAEKLSEFEFDLLDKEQQMTYKILWERFEAEEEAADLRLYQEVLNYGQGEHNELPILLTTFNIRTKEDANNYLELVADIDEYFRAIIEYEQRRSEAGLFMSDDALDLVIEDCELYADREAANILVESFPEQLSEIKCITEEEKQEYVECLQTVVEENFYPAYEVLIEGLEKLRGTGTNDEGICNFKKGKEYYEYLVKSTVGTSYEMDGLFEVVNEAFQKDYADNTAFNRSENSGVLESLLGEEFDSADTREIAELMRERTKEDWPDIGEIEYEFREVPENLEQSMNPAFYKVPQLDVPSKNHIYVNNLYGLEDIWPIVAHEGIPGHMYQFNYNQKKGYQPIRRLLENNGYTEGWGTYAEIYSLSYAGISGEAARARKLINLESLGLPAMLDMGINYEGWSREETYDKLCELYDEESSTGIINAVYDFIANNPAVYLSYYIGYLEITDMREEAEEKLGEDFCLKDFHTFMLDEGNAPFTIIRDDFRVWLSEQPA